MTISQICICLAIAVYLIAMLGVGVWFSKRNNSVDDFYLGGRKLGPFVTAMSAEASDMSSWLLMGLDRHRTGCGHLSELAHRGAAHPPLLPPDRRHHSAPVLLQALGG